MKGNKITLINITSYSKQCLSHPDVQGLPSGHDGGEPRAPGVDREHGGTGRRGAAHRLLRVQVRRGGFRGVSATRAARRGLHGHQVHGGLPLLHQHGHVRWCRPWVSYELYKPFDRFSV